VREVCESALEAPDRRVPQVATADRRVMSRIANPLRLGVQSEQAFLLDVSQRWETHFTRKLAERTQSGAEGHATVGELRRWIDEPSPMGLSKELQNLVLIVWAATTDRIFTDHGGPARVGIDALADHYEVVAQELPDAASWAEATSRAERVLGMAGLPPEPSAVALAKLSNGLASAASEHLAAAESLSGELGSLAAVVGLGSAARIETAGHAAQLLQAVASAGSDLDKVEAFLAADLRPSPEAIGASIKSAAAVNGTIASVDTELLAAAMAREEGAAISDRLSELLAADEFVIALAPELRDLVAQARKLVYTEAPPVIAPPVPGPAGGGSTTPVATGGDGAVIATSTGLSSEDAAKRLKDLRKQIETGEFGEGPFDIEIRTTGDAPS